MKNKKFAILIFHILSLSLLYGCIGDDTPPLEISNTINNATDITKEEEINATPRGFGLAYYTAETINPVLSRNKVNITLSKILFEGLFELDGDFNPVPILCESYSTPDGITYTLNIKDNILFHSGSKLTASDVAYSLNLAKDTNTSPYYSRLSDVVSIRDTSPLTVKIILKRANTSFINLLDIPIFKKGSEGNQFSDGTGPYMPHRSDNEWLLIPFTNWHISNVSSIAEINLISTTRPDTVGYSFETGDISLVLSERISVDPMSYKGDINIYQAKTTNMHYLNVNTTKFPYNIPEFRKALSYAMDRDSIVKTALQDSAMPAILPVNPQPTALVDNINMNKNLDAALFELDKANIRDTNSDGILEYTDASGNTSPIIINILVNEDNLFKHAVLEKYATDLNSIGIKSNITMLPFKEFNEQISLGNYDVYYGEVILEPDFDMRSIISANAKLNHGKFYDADLENAMNKYFSTFADEKVENEKYFYNKFIEKMPIIVISFENIEVIAWRKAVKEIAPRPYNIFYNIQNWDMNVEG